MAATITIVITGANETIANLNDKLNLTSGVDAHNLLNLAADYVSRTSMGGVSGATVQVTSRDTAPTIATSGTSSTQITVTIG